MSEAEDNKVKRTGSATGRSGRNSVLVEKGVRTPRGAEVWHVRADGKVLTLTTSTSSAAVMDDAVRIYSLALERLAKR